MSRSVEQKSVIEKFLLTNPAWAEGYRAFNRLFGHPLGWLYIIHDGKSRLIRLNQKGNCTFFAASANNQAGCVGFLLKYCEQLKDSADQKKFKPFNYKCAYGRKGLVFTLDYLNQLKGYLILCATSKNEKDTRELMPLFHQFVKTQIELAYKAFELQNFYETVHPRALALSTMHSVHRVISSSLHLNELLPKIGRLCAQILKAQGCTIFLLDEEKKYLVPQFHLQNQKDIGKRSKIRMGRGIEGRVGETAEFHVSKNCICVPFIEEDVIGVITLRDKIGGEGFGKMDMEILKTLSEQAVVAIKNAKLFEETENLTHSSIQAINELLEMSYEGSNMQLPLFGEMVFEMGKDLHLSSMQLTHLHRATFLIDAGHLGTPPHILQKKTRLTKREFDAIKEHPHAGASVLKKMGALKPVIPIILYHHERYDGKGYPQGLKGDKIPISARIMSVADAFFAMIAERPYRSAKSFTEAVNEIKRNSNSQFDPLVVASFLKVIENHEFMKKISRWEQAQAKTEPREYDSRHKIALV